MNVPKSSLDHYHYPVMLNEVIKHTSPEYGGRYVDCTFGGGGYSKELLKFNGTSVIALDRDKTVIEKANEVKKIFPKRFTFFNEKFSNLEKVLSEENKVDTIIFDLGVSSFQLLDMSRGFSFKSKEKIDMSMGLSSFSAEEIINNYEANDLKAILKILGEEKDASNIVKNILKARKIKKISKVSELVQIIEKSKKKNYTKKINVCTKTFQALRIFVNKETTELIEGIIKATKFIRVGGKIIVVSFHSIEDKIVKFYFNNYSANRPNPSRYLPARKNEDTLLFEKYKNIIIKPSQNELDKNPPSRSAKLRFAVRSNKKFIDPIEFKLKFKKYINLEKINV